MEPTLEPAWALFKATWKWIVGGGLLAYVGRPIAAAVAEWWRDRIARNADLRRKRAEVVDGIQKHLVTVQRALQGATGLQPPSDPHGRQQIREAVEAEDVARGYIETHRHYLLDSTASVVDRFMEEARRACAALMVGADTRELAGEEAARQASQLTRKGHDIVRKKLPPIMDELRGEFRRLVEGRRRLKKSATRQNRRIKS